MRVVWGRANSSNVMKVVWLLQELGLPYERVDAGGAFGRTRDSQYLAMNPTGTVPTLQEDEFSLWESNAILRYLAGEHAAGAPIWPPGARARANVDRWMDFQQTALGPPMTVVFQGLVRTSADQRDNAAIEAAVSRAGAVYALLDAQLGRDAYVAGPDFTLADISIGVHVHRWFSFDTLRPDQPSLRRWYDRLLERPAYRQHAAQPMS